MGDGRGECRGTFFRRRGGRDYIMEPPRGRGIITSTRAECENHVLSAPVAGTGQSSSVMLDQKIQIMTTARRVKRVAKRPPLMAPEVPVQMWGLAMYWKTWPMTKSRAALER